MPSKPVKKSTKPVSKPVTQPIATKKTHDPHGVITRHICLSRDLGVGGNLYGGQMLGWIDEAAAIYGMLVVGSERVVTRAFEHAEFRQPVKLGDLVEFIADGYKIGNTSITVKLKVEILEVSTGHRIDTHGVSVTLVHVSKNGMPMPIQHG